jgi:hypothetical protein
LDNKIIEITADSLDGAQKQVRSTIPEGLSLLSEEVLSDGKPRTVSGIGENPEDAFETAQRKVPAGAVVVASTQAIGAGNKTIVVQALDEDGAKTQAERTLSDGASVKGLRLLAKGRRGFLGIGGSANNYEVHIHQRTVVQITFKETARIRATIGPRPTPKPAALDRTATLMKDLIFHLVYMGRAIAYLEQCGSLDAGKVRHVDSLLPGGEGLDKFKLVLSEIHYQLSGSRLYPQEMGHVNLPTTDIAKLKTIAQELLRRTFNDLKPVLEETLRKEASTPAVQTLLSIVQKWAPEQTPEVMIALGVKPATE